jgi:hypothetical protein
VAVGAARYSVPAEYVGKLVSVQESAEHYEFFHEGKLVARHPKAARHTVVMEPAHYADCCMSVVKPHSRQLRASIPASAGLAR